jgi:hypothetical protein
VTSLNRSRQRWDEGGIDLGQVTKMSMATPRRTKAMVEIMAGPDSRVSEGSAQRQGLDAHRCRSKDHAKVARSTLHIDAK